MKLIRPFFDANRRLCHWIESKLPHARPDLFAGYETTVARYMNGRPAQVVVDVGGGKGCPFAKYRDPTFGTRIIAVDISDEEIKDNRDVDEARVANIMQDLPLETDEAHMIVSRSVLEHLTDLEAFVAASERVLKSGGHFIHLLPGRFAPFAVINRALPNWLSRKVLNFFQPQTAGICGFPAFYDRCNHSALVQLLGARGFDIEESSVSYYQSRYFNFFVPLYMASVCYELIARAVGVPDLGAYVLVVARKR